MKKKAHQFSHQLHLKGNFTILSALYERLIVNTEAVVHHFNQN